MKNFCIWFESGKTLVITAYEFYWDSDECTISFSDGEEDTIAVFKTDYITGVSLLCEDGVNDVRLLGVDHTTLIVKEDS